METPEFDKDGYATTATLLYIADWSAEELHGLVDFVCKAWHWPALAQRSKKRLQLHTGGWSGNEAVIRALEKQHIFWLLCWEKSTRGGHYYFDLSRIPEGK